jgi:hypothetical protein
MLKKITQAQKAKRPRFHSYTEYRVKIIKIIIIIMGHEHKRQTMGE